MARNLYIFGAILLLSGCGKPPIGMPFGIGQPKKVCTMMAVSGLGVMIYLPPGVSANGLQAEVSNNDGFKDVFKQNEFDSNNSGGLGFATAWEQEGTYSVTVSHPAFASQTKSDIVVTSDGCHVDHQAVEFRF